MKKLYIAFFLVFCFATASYAVDPFKANRGGFGPVIKGIQLGSRVSLLELVALGIDFQTWPFKLNIFESDKSYLRINFEGNGRELKSFEIKESKGSFSFYENQSWKLGDLLGEVEKRGGILAVNLETRGLLIMLCDLTPEGRIKRCRMGASMFRAGALTVKEFIQMFIEAYNIPEVTRDPNKHYQSWQYRNLSEGWEIEMAAFNINGLEGMQGIEIRAIVSEAAFN